MRRNASSTSDTIFCVPTTRMTFPAPAAYGASWLPLAEAATSDPVSVTACTLPTKSAGGSRRPASRGPCSRCVGGWARTDQSCGSPRQCRFPRASARRRCGPGLRPERDPRRSVSPPRRPGTNDGDSVGFESSGGPRDAGIVRHDRELTAKRPLEIRLVLGIHGFRLADEAIYLRPQIQYCLGDCVCK
jgi:hypothetical protein